MLLYLDVLAGDLDHPGAVSTDLRHWSSLKTLDY